MKAVADKAIKAAALKKSPRLVRNPARLDGAGADVIPQKDSEASTAIRERLMRIPDLPSQCNEPCRLVDPLKEGEPDVMDTADLDAEMVSAPGAKSKRRRPQRLQKRALDSRQAIISAALDEFAEKGYDAASIRAIAARVGIQHPLITYHFKTKELLWKATADHVISEVRQNWLLLTQGPDDKTPVEKVRAEIRALFIIQQKYPGFHQFMMHESRGNSPRLPWLAEKVISGMVNAMLPEIRRAQASGHLPAGEPILLLYMMNAMTSVLSTLGGEIEAVTGLVVNTAEAQQSYFDLLDRVMFSRRPD